MHAYVGIAIGVLNLLGLLIIWDALGWRFWWRNTHCWTGNLSTFFGFALVIGGLVQYYLQKKVSLEWKTHQLLML